MPPTYSYPSLSLSRALLYYLSQELGSANSKHLPSWKNQLPVQVFNDVLPSPSPYAPYVLSIMNHEFTPFVPDDLGVIFGKIKRLLVHGYSLTWWWPCSSVWKKSCSVSTARSSRGAASLPQLPARLLIQAPGTHPLFQGHLHGQGTATACRGVTLQGDTVVGMWLESSATCKQEPRTAWLLLFWEKGNFPALCSFSVAVMGCSCGKNHNCCRAALIGTFLSVFPTWVNWVTKES